MLFLAYVIFLIFLTFFVLVIEKGIHLHNKEEDKKEEKKEEKRIEEEIKSPKNDEIHSFEFIKRSQIDIEPSGPSSRNFQDD